MSSYEDDSADSDPGDYTRDIGGITSNQARSGDGRIRFNVDMMTFVFMHAIEKNYSSKRPPSAATFFELIQQLLVFTPGLRSSVRYVRAVGNWITRNVSAARLPGLLDEKLKTSIRGKSVYEVSCSLALLEAVHEPGFSYSELHPASAIAERHAELRRKMLPWHSPPIDQPGWKRVVDISISWLVSTGKIVSSSTGQGQQNIGSVPPPYITGHLATFNTAQGQLNAGASTANRPSFNVDAYSSESTPLYSADKVRAGQNEECWCFWKTFLHKKFAGIARNNPHDPVHPYIQNLLDWNDGVLDYKETNDYMGWLIDINRANFNQWTEWQC